MTSTDPRPGTGRPSYGERLAAVTGRRGRLCVGIDPHPGLLSTWGLADDASGLEVFARGVVSAVGDLVAVFKPQSALFERFGSAGIAVLERVLADVAAAGALSVLDAKRGDIGSTMAGYARAYLDDGGPLAADALTVNPYLGLEALEPAFTAAAASGRGLYVLARTSNPDSAQLQLATRDGRTVAQTVVDEVQARNDALRPDPGSGVESGAAGPFGVVVGGTHGQAELDLSAFDGSVLVPGVGAQGATVADLAERFSVPRLLLPSSSRGVLAAGPDPSGLRQAVTALVAETAVLG
ncbi:orotidine-5'-phosphate decarboxylase [Desertihabitans brevis]|uniref:Orotidine 5'-phosphate decarboxylase n=1 Tax=Desertihabitans brevis TaxID=2268447 RepID=A0A367YZA6_9ACTN|nr:orotidine-5'-phosphate decarboxylase [Desertihabitans brevis]RCK71158.1 orotidine-5'-phosphate decarboxylase [Desertihabitans brevis]